MSYPFHTSVALDRVPHNDWHYTVKLAAGITAADVGKALALDGANANQFKLADADEPVVARLEQVEDRTNEGQLLGLAAFKFIDVLPHDGTVAVGESVIGGADGVVKQAAALRQDNLCIETRTGNLAVVLMK